jgi:hypothetical protein
MTDATAQPTPRDGATSTASPSASQSVSTTDPAASVTRLDLATMLGGALKVAAGLGAIATAYGFVVVSARFVAAELPVMEGLESVGVRSVIATGARALAPLLMACVLILAVVPFSLGRKKRTQRTSSAEAEARRLIIGMSL